MIEANDGEFTQVVSATYPGLQKGDAVLAKVRVINDGSVPNAAENELFAEAGTMGMLVNIGHFEDNPDEELFLVCFQLENGELGPPVTCLADEIEPLPQTSH